MMFEAKVPHVINALANLPECYPYVSHDKEAHVLCRDFYDMRALLEQDAALAQDEDFMKELGRRAVLFRGVTLNFSACFVYPETGERRPEGEYTFFHNGKDDEDLQGASIAMLFEWSAPGTFEMHTMSRKTARGGEALAFAEKCVYEMFVNRDAHAVWGQTPISNERARAFNVKLGAISRGFKTHYALGPCELFFTTREEWNAFRKGHGGLNTSSN